MAPTRARGREGRPTFTLYCAGASGLRPAPSEYVQRCRAPGAGGRRRRLRQTTAGEVSRNARLRGRDRGDVGRGYRRTTQESVRGGGRGSAAAPRLWQRRGRSLIHI